MNERNGKESEELSITDKMSKEDILAVYHKLQKKYEELLYLFDHNENITKTQSNELLKYKTIFQETKHGLALIDYNSGKIIEANFEFEEQTGRAIEYLKKLTIWEVRPINKQAQAKKIHEQAKANGYAESTELDFERPNGEIVHIGYYSKLITLGGKKYLLCITRDITDSAKEVKKIVDNQKLLQKQRDELESFASTIAHDIRGKLQVISTYNELAEDSFYRSKINEQIDAIVKFLESLLILAKEGEIIGELKKINLNEMFEDLIQKVFTLNPKIKVEIDKLPILIGDPQKLHQVFENIMINAAKHAKASLITISGETVGDKVIIMISDNGKGMDYKTIEKIHHAWDTKKYTTLGLMIVKKIIDAHNGSVSFTSKLNEGTTFRIELPQKQ